jgi:hypothetical protein
MTVIPLPNSSLRPVLPSYVGKDFAISPRTITIPLACSNDQSHFHARAGVPSWSFRMSIKPDNTTERGHHSRQASESVKHELSRISVSLS